MLEEIALGKSKEFRNNFIKLFSDAEKIEVTITTPERIRRKSLVYWYPEISLWAFFPDKPLKGNRWGLWFGCKNPLKNSPLTPNVEINIATAPSAGIYGRGLVDKNGTYFLAHRGFLGGRRPGAKTLIEFREEIKKISDFKPVDIININGKIEDVFLIGNVKEKDKTLATLAKYVKACKDIRENSRQNSLKPYTSATI